jgi:hypothetical protein
MCRFGSDDYLKMEVTEPLLKQAWDELGFAKMQDLAKSRVWPEVKDQFSPISQAIEKLKFALPSNRPRVVLCSKPSPGQYLISSWTSAP